MDSDLDNERSMVKYTVESGLRVDLRDLDFTAALENASAQKEITVLEHGQTHTACIYSYFIEDFWMSVCGKEKVKNHVLHLL